MIFLKGFVIGFFASSLPGPASMSVLEGAKSSHRLQVYRSISSLVLGDVFVFFLCFFFFFHFQTEIDRFLLKTASSVFLIAYALFSFLKRPRTSKSPKGGAKTFILTLLSPGVWLINFALVALGAADGWSDVFIYFLGLQLGVFVWFALLTRWLCVQTQLRQEVFRRGCLSLMLVAGLWSFFI